MKLFYFDNAWWNPAQVISINGRASLNNDGKYYIYLLHAHGQNQIAIGEYDRGKAILSEKVKELEDCLNAI